MRGILVYQFDFCGVSLFSKNEGDSTKMSVMTEAEDLECVIEQMKNLLFVDKTKFI